MKKVNIYTGKVKQNDRIFTLKVKTESNSLGVLKTLLVVAIIALQLAILILTNLYFFQLFKWYLSLSFIISILTCIYVLSSDYHGQAKAIWIIFLLLCIGFGSFVYFLSDEHILFVRAKKKYSKILNSTRELQSQPPLDYIVDNEIKTTANYLYNAGSFRASTTTKCNYYPSGASFFDQVLEDLENAHEFIFLEFFIISDGVLLSRTLDILKRKAEQGVDVRIIYDDMGSHGTLSRKAKKIIKSASIKLLAFNKLIPVFNLALNIRDHRKIVVVDGKVGFTGGTNLADEYVNEKRMHGYWKDMGIRLEGDAVDNLTIAFLTQWQFLSNKAVDYTSYINKVTPSTTTCNNVVVPFVSGPHMPYSIAHGIYTSIMSEAQEKLYIMTPYFIPDETITNILLNKARAGVDVRIILPDIADKKFVYIVSRNNAEKLMEQGIKLYTMTHSFVHSKVILTENSSIVGSINVDHRSFTQQFESAVYTNDANLLREVEADFEKTIKVSNKITMKNRKRISHAYRICAGILNIISPFM